MSLYLDDGDVRLYHGDALTVLQTLEDASVHMCVTSPPFYGLRDYGVTGQIGLEETPEQWVDSLVAVFREVRRVLRDDGTLWLEVGDSYNSIGGTVGGGKNCEPRKPTLRGWANVKPKDLIGAPWMLAFALRNDGWYLRSDIVWARPNPMPESVTDRPTKSHSYIFLLAKQPRYFFDQEAVREPLDRPDLVDAVRQMGTPNKGAHPMQEHNHIVRENRYANPAGRNVRSVWNIATQPFSGAHFAVFPEELARRCILAGTSERGCCPECGAPWIRQVEPGESTYVERKALGYDKPANVSSEHGGGHGIIHPPGFTHTLTPKPSQTVGWRPLCTCKVWRGREPVLADPVPCVVLDPFVGSGTVPYVARKHGRHAIGIDLSQSYLELAARRLQQLSLFA